jgi:hypothetical protein
MTEATAWMACGLSILIFAIYEGRVLWIGRKSPHRMARYAHARMRVSWVAALSEKAGFEIVAVQALRNSLMSATIAASTAALAMMGAITLAGRTVAEVIAGSGDGVLSHRAVLEILLMLVLFASYVCSAMAMRYFNHAGFVMSMPAGSPARQPFNRMASDYVERAGLLYSWGLRFFLMVAPILAGILNALAMPPMTIVLLVVLWFFDQPALTEQVDDAKLTQRFPVGTRQDDQ